MPLYTAYYPSDFARVCFEIGVIMTLLSAINPIGIICAVTNLVSYIDHRKDADHKPSSKILLWVIVGPILTTLFWCLSIFFFVSHSGGV